LRFSRSSQARPFASKLSQKVAVVCHGAQYRSDRARNGALSHDPKRTISHARERAK
jgi:hypothetical protein